MFPIGLEGAGGRCRSRFAAMTAAVFTLMGGFASRLAGWLQARPRVVRGVNIGAGLTFIAAGLSVLSLKQRGMS